MGSGEAVVIEPLIRLATNPLIRPSDISFVRASGTFNPGVTVQYVTINVKGDTSTEADETFFVILTQPVNAVVLAVGSGDRGTGTIRNDDGLVAGASISSSGTVATGSGTSTSLATNSGVAKSVSSPISVPQTAPKPAAAPAPQPAVAAVAKKTSAVSPVLSPLLVDKVFSVLK